MQNAKYSSIFSSDLSEADNDIIKTLNKQVKIYESDKYQNLINSIYSAKSLESYKNAQRRFKLAEMLRKNSNKTNQDGSINEDEDF